MKLIVSTDPKELTDRAAAEFVRIVNDSIRDRGRVSVALSGGSTPKALYRKLVTMGLEWEKVIFFFGDERNVSPDDEQSNFRLANEELLKYLPVIRENVRRWRTEVGQPENIALDYERELDQYFKAFPSFDLILLGMGADGHTASLFPGTTALHETEKQAVANWVPQLDTWRYTFTFPVINNARNVMFLVAGDEKAAVLKDVLEGEKSPGELPSQSVHPKNGELYWFVDRAAASLLTSV